MLDAGQLQGKVPERAIEKQGKGIQFIADLYGQD